MMLLTVADVTLRASFNLPIRGVYELVELLLAATFFVALPAVFLRDENIVVNSIDDHGAARGADAQAVRRTAGGGRARRHGVAGLSSRARQLRIPRCDRRPRPAARLALGSRC